MMQRKRPRRIGVGRRYDKRLKSTAGNGVQRVVMEGQLADHSLYRNFPNARGADDDPILWIGNSRSHSLAQSRVVHVPPDEDVRIEQQVHVRGRIRIA